MSILIVGNVLKDVYLGLDPRSEHAERDRTGISWLNLAFDASPHHFFRRISSYGGAAVSLEVLHQMGLAASVSGSSFTIGAHQETPPETYRYILTYDDKVSYFTPSAPTHTRFTAPDTPVDYLYIDRSAHLDAATTAKITDYLAQHQSTKLILYFAPTSDSAQNLAILAPKATLIFTDAPVLDPAKTVYLSESKFSFGQISQPITISRADTITHLSLYSIAAATILGAFILGESVESSLKLAKVNVENSTLNATLPLKDLRTLAGQLKSQKSELELIAASLVRPGKGILAADESGGSIAKKFAQLQIPDTFTNRHAYRDIFFTTPSLERYLSGVILFDETARDHAQDGRTYVDFLTAQRLIPGIKVDQGLAPIEKSRAGAKSRPNTTTKDQDTPAETYTKGLDGLDHRLAEYYQMGLRFAKWRAAFTLTLDDQGQIITPSQPAIEQNCWILAEYASACQKNGLVPIVEPEIVYDGYYTIEKCAEATGHVLDELFKALKARKVNLKACILKVNMVLAGKQMHAQSTPQQVGRATARTLRQHVPPELAGVVFLSGGQTPEQATANLAAVLQHGPFPWPVTFSFARALQDPTLYAWAGQPDNVKKARQAFADRLSENAKAIQP